MHPAGLPFVAGGLGLAAVLGIVHGHRGGIRVTRIGEPAPRANAQWNRSAELEIAEENQGVDSCE